MVIRIAKPIPLGCPSGPVFEADVSMGLDSGRAVRRSYAHAVTWSLEERWPRPSVMGVLNVTPDSFSDGGRFVEPADAVAHGLRLVDEADPVGGAGAAR